MGATHVDAGKETKNVLKFVKNFWSAIAKREINFFWILLLGMSHGFIILTLKKNDWAWNRGTLHFLARNKFKTLPSAGKILLTVFWDSQRVYMTEFWGAGKTVNSARYIETIKNLRRRVCRVRGGVNIADFVAAWQCKTAHCSRNDWCSGDAEVWSSLPSTLQPWLGAKRFPFLSSLQEGSQGDSFHLRWWSEASCDVVDQTKNSWILHWRHA